MKIKMKGKRVVIIDKNVGKGIKNGSYKMWNSRGIKWRG